MANGQSYFFRETKLHPNALPLLPYVYVYTMELLKWPVLTPRVTGSATTHSATCDWKY